LVPNWCHLPTQALPEFASTFAARAASSLLCWRTYPAKSVLGYRRHVDVTAYRLTDLRVEWFNVRITTSSNVILHSFDSVRNGS